MDNEYKKAKSLDGWMGGWVDGWMDGYLFRSVPNRRQCVILQGME
jgi:hypothetical protein